MSRNGNGKHNGRSYSDGALQATYLTITRSGADAVDGEIIHERLVSVFVTEENCGPLVLPP